MCRQEKWESLHWKTTYFSHWNFFLLLHIFWHFLIAFSLCFLITLLSKILHCVQSFPESSRQIIWAPISCCGIYFIVYFMSGRVHLLLIRKELFKVAFNWANYLLPRDIVAHRIGVRNYQLIWVFVSEWG